LSEFDYSQIEPRIFGYFTAKALKDDTVATWYREGRDVYREIAAAVYGKPAEEITDDERQNGKIWFLMSLYGAGPKKVSEAVGMSYSEAKKFYLQFHEGLPQIKRLSNPKPKSERAMKHWTPGALERVYAKRGYLKTPLGMHLHAEQFGEFKLLNKLIQGTAAGVQKVAMIRVDDWIFSSGIESRMVSQVHDSLIFDGPVHEVPLLHEHVPQLMREDWLTEVIPVEVDHEVSTTTWADKIPYDEWLATQEVAA
jgi:DNA polymerase I